MLAIKCKNTKTFHTWDIRSWNAYARIGAAFFILSTTDFSLWVIDYKEYCTMNIVRSMRINNRVHLQATYIPTAVKLNESLAFSYGNSDLIQTWWFYLVELLTGSSQKGRLHTNCVGGSEQFRLNSGDGDITYLFRVWKRWVKDQPGWENLFQTQLHCLTPNNQQSFSEYFL